MSAEDRTSFLITYTPLEGFPGAEEIGGVLKNCFTSANNWQPETVQVVEESEARCVIRLIWPKDKHPKTATVHYTLFEKHDLRMIEDITRENGGMSEIDRANMMKVKSLISKSGLSKKSGKVKKPATAKTTKKANKRRAVTSSDEEDI